MSQIEWPAGKSVPAVGEVWRRKRNGRLVTITHVPTSGVAPEVHYDMGGGKDGYTWTGNWHSTFERTDEDPFAYLRSCSNMVLRRLADECEAIIAVRAEDGVKS